MDLKQATLIVKQLAKFGKDWLVQWGATDAELWQAIDMVRVENLQRCARYQRKMGATYKMFARRYRWKQAEAISRKHYRYAVKLVNKLDTLRLVSSVAGFESSR
jgi:hypothetical protein